MVLSANSRFIDSALLLVALPWVVVSACGKTESNPDRGGISGTAVSVGTVVTSFGSATTTGSSTPGPVAECVVCNADMLWEASNDCE